MTIFQQVYLSIALIGSPTPDLNCMAEAIYFEARGEPLQGQIAVAQVILKRARSGRFPATICGVVHQPKAFSYYWDHKPEKITDQRAYREARINAAFVLAGLCGDQTGGALYYHEAGIRPYWSTGQGVQIGNHRFLIGVR